MKYIVHYYILALANDGKKKQKYMVFGIDEM